MVRLEWNALRVGDHVLVHDPSDAEMQLLPGVVTMVQTVSGSNDIGIRVASGDGGFRVLRPTRLTVHPDPRDLTEECWRCDAIATKSAPRRDPVVAGVA
jgi:hypothetical protein